jgi:hypothetical protein
LTSENFLRGYQYTDSNGQVAFTTIYPGWYTGRTVHIHIKVRIFNSSGNVTTEATTQLFFADSISTAVYSANSTYTRSGTRDTLNSSDSIYNEESPTLLISLTGDATVWLCRVRLHRHSRRDDLRRLGRFRQREVDGNKCLSPKGHSARMVSIHPPPNFFHAVLPQVPQNTLLVPFLRTVVLHQNY